MTIESNPPRTLTTVVSWLALVSALASVLYLAILIPTNRTMYERTLREFKVELPAATIFLFKIPAAVFPIAAVFVATICGVVQYRFRGQGGAALFHMLVIVLCCVAFTTYREVLMQPLFHLILALHGER